LLVAAVVVAVVVAGSCALVYLLAHEKRLVEIGVVATDVHGHVNVDNVAVLQRSVVRHTVANDLIDRGAHTLGEIVVIERRGVRIMGNGGFVHDTVNLITCDAHAHCLATCIKHGAADDAGGAHALQLLVRVHFNAVVGSLVLYLTYSVSLSLVAWCGWREV
jgi:hypothetical protein